MKIKSLLFTAVLSLTAAINASAQQPLNMCCHPDDIKNWTPGVNADDAFNVAKVPLAKRFQEPTLMKANANQYYGGEVCNSTILFPTCSLCPSQGANNYTGYQPTYWQYLDKLVYWAGAASEGIINMPPAASTDAAHAQGVKSIGNIFFPPSAYGGDQAWVRQMLTVENGHYIYAQKLYALCKYFNFDGWFINEETGGGSQSEWVGFFKEFYASAAADGNTTAELQWYNADGTPNTDILSTNINTSQFLEYGSVGDHRSYASSIGCTAAQTMSKIYGGVQCVYSGLTGYNSALNSAYPTTGHVGSLDLFCPEERAWKDNMKNYLSNGMDSEDAFTAMQKTFANENKVWTNTTGDPSTGGTSSWRGFSGAILERSVISSMPFLTDFCSGVGRARFVQGEKQGSNAWYHSGVQSILPTWRYWIEEKTGLTVSFDWTDAYNFGNSLKIAGSLSAGDHLMRLYKTQIPVTAGGTLRLVYKTSTEGSVEVKLSTASSTTPDVTLSNPTTTSKNGWTVAEYDLASLNGKTIYMIALNMKAAAAVSGYTLNLGELAVLPAGYAPAAVAVNDLATTSTLGEEKGDIRVTWNYTYVNDFDHFDVYLTHADGTRTLAGQTRDQAFYIPTITRANNEAGVKVDVVPVMKDGAQKAAQTLDVKFPTPQPPTITLALSKSYIKVGETTEMTAKGTGSPKSFEWVLPAGLQLADGYTLTSNPIKVTGVAAGKQSVTIKATNDVGTTEKTMEAVDVMADDGEMSEVQNVVVHKKVVAFSGSTNSTEVPTNIIDGVTSPAQTYAKWCNISPDSWATFDCEGAYRIYGFRIYDGNSGPESGVDQIDSYKIQLSSDGTNWTTVVDTENRANESIKTDYIAPFKARYVKLIPHVNGTLRIWEFEVYGKDDNNMTVEINPTELTLTNGETKNVTMKYNLNGDQRAAQFTCTAKSANGNVTIGNITEDAAAGTFTIPVTGGNIIGTDKLTVTVNNGGSYKERNVDVNIDSNTQPNVLSGQKAILRQFNADYSYEATYTDHELTTLTDGNTTVDACKDIADLKPSTHKRDIWAIFTAPTEEGWNLAKVKVSLPNNNRGTNDNGVEGNVNKEISIAIGNDLKNMTVVKTFSSLADVQSLEYIFPEYRNCKYLAIECTLNAYYYAAMAEVEATEQYDSAIPVNGPVSLSGWNYDVIAESTDAKTTTNGSLDDQNYVLYSTTCKANGALAGDDHKITATDGTVYTVADYTQNNALVMKDGDAHTLTFNSPAKCEELYFIMISANGSSTVSVTANYEDGTTSDATSMSPSDWWSSYQDGSEAIYGLGRIGSSDNVFDTRLQFRLFSFTMYTDKSKKIKSLNIYRSSYTGYPTILAISKKGYKDATGISKVVNDPTNRTIVGIYTINGMKVNTPQKGLNIIRYSDGTAKKIIIK